MGQRKGPRDVVGVKLLDTMGKSTRRLTGRFTRRFVFTRAVNVAEKVCLSPSFGETSRVTADADQQERDKVIYLREMGIMGSFQGYAGVGSEGS